MTRSSAEFLASPQTSAFARCCPNGAGVIFNELTVCRKGRDLLKDITAVVPCGGATVIIGPNGAGKTTLLRCILGENAYEGYIAYVDHSGRKRRKCRIAYVPQHLYADAHMPLKVYEFLSLGQRLPLWLGCSSKNRAAAESALELTGASHLLNSRLGDLSGGEQRRVLLASALSHKPELLVLDEAEAGVDFRGERLFWELLDKSRKELGYTLLMVSHNLPLAAHYATWVLCIKQRLLAQGPPREALTGANLLELFGAPIHLFPGQCENPGPTCPDCGAFGNLPYLASGEENLKPPA